MNRLAERRSVAGIAEENGRVFAARRKPGGALGGKWEFPGGKVRQDESDGGALIREFAEELNVSVTPGSFIGETEFVHGTTRFTLAAYRVEFADRDFVMNEHVEYRWVRAGELETLDFADSDRGLFPRIKKMLSAF